MKKWKRESQQRKWELHQVHLSHKIIKKGEIMPDMNSLSRVIKKKQMKMIIYCDPITRNHFYHVGGREINRNPTIEVLVLNFKPNNKNMGGKWMNLRFRYLNLEVNFGDRDTLRCFVPWALNKRICGSLTLAPICLQQTSHIRNTLAEIPHAALGGEQND